MIEGSASVALKKAKNHLVVGEGNEALSETLNAARFLNVINSPILGLDIDGTITESCFFFATLSKWWPNKVIIVTYRKDRAKAEKDLAELDISYDELILTDSMDKSQIIIDNHIGVYVDDQDECILNIPENVTVLKIRNGGNSENGRWLYSQDTGKSI
jgi:uncharacterized HAD superfamily protein